VRSLSRQVSRQRQHAITDALTGLYNFGFFQERLEIEVARARETGDPIALALFDIDRFKDYNDTHGHPEGNRVLVRLAALLRACGRRGDVVCRYGGEEFVFLLYGAGREDATALAEGVRRRVEEVFAAEGFPSPVTVSGGVALFPDDARDPDSFVSAADARLYAAKKMGRNRVES
jgi:diguanylate cyclase (GGDEF)-like protein